MINNQGVVTGQIRDIERIEVQKQVKEVEVVTNFIWHETVGIITLPYKPTCRPALINNHNKMSDIYWFFTNYWIFPNQGYKHVLLMSVLTDPGYLLWDIGTPKGWKTQSLDSWQYVKLPSSKIPNPDSIWDDHELSVIGFNDLNQILIANSCHDKKRTQYAIWTLGEHAPLEKEFFPKDFIPIDSSILDKAYAINNHGIILGRQWVMHEGNNVPMLVLYDTLSNTVLPAIKDVELVTSDLNDLNQIVGVRKNFLNPNKTEGFLWDPEDGLVLLDSFIPTAINNKGQIVGYQTHPDGSQTPALMHMGDIIDLNKLLDLENANSAWVKINIVKDINDAGYIVGEGIFDGKPHGFLLAPKI